MKIVLNILRYSIVAFVLLITAPVWITPVLLIWTFNPIVKKLKEMEDKAITSS